MAAWKSRMRRLRPAVERLEDRRLLAGTIIDHNDLAVVQALPDSAFTAVNQQRWFFTHASVGGNMLEGMGDLNAANAARYALVQEWVGYNDVLQRADNPPVSTAQGTIYECNRGNPGWSEKVTIINNSVQTSGWRSSKIDLAMNKLCFIDETANATTYLSSMSLLESSYPATKFVYTTMPLTTATDSANYLRNVFNNAVLAYCSANGKLLLDVADIEAFSPAGVAQTYVSGSNTYDRLYARYTSDGGHLDDAGNVGRDRVALGWYAAGALAAGTLGTPTAINLSANSIAERRPVGTEIGTFTSIDRDAGDTFTYSLVSGDGSTDNADFTIDSQGKLRTASVFDFEAKSSYSIRVRSTDSGGRSFERTFAISVTDVVEPAILPDSVVAGFGGTVGSWSWKNDGSWTWLHNSTPIWMVSGDLDGNGKSDVVANFGGSVGFWIRHDSGVWEWIHNLPSTVAATADLNAIGRDELILSTSDDRVELAISISDPAYAGLWEYTPTTGQWPHTSGWQAESFVVVDVDASGRKDLAVDFGANGLWVWKNEANWQWLHSLDAAVTAGAHFGAAAPAAAMSASAHGEILAAIAYDLGLQDDAIDALLPAKRRSVGNALRGVP